MIGITTSGIVGEYRQVVGWGLSGAGGGSKIKKMDQKLRWRSEIKIVDQNLIGTPRRGQAPGGLWITEVQLS